MIRLYHRVVNARWLLLVHQIPPEPAYLRVKVARRLARIGAVAIKNTVYVLPSGDEALEDFQWVVREVTAGGGSASVLEARLVDGLTDADVEQLFRDARDVDYAALARDGAALAARIEQRSVEGERAHQIELTRLLRRLQEISGVDFFEASGRQAASAMLASLRAQLTEKDSSEPTAPAPEADYRARCWVTRRGVHVDRIASAWLIRRFIDPEARFRFVDARGYTPAPGELRFDMFEAEFTHEGDKCTFEVLCSRFSLEQPGLGLLAQLIHDIDVKDDKFGRPETAGLAAQIAGLALVHRDDDARLEAGAALMDQLLAYLAKKT